MVFLIMNDGLGDHPASPICCTMHSALPRNTRNITHGTGKALNVITALPMRLVTRYAPAV
jgi:hypothetical protein